jgi:hypothetical protein
MTNAMTMPMGQHGVRHITRWSVLVASCEAPKRRHRASARAILVIAVAVDQNTTQNTTFS